MPRLRRLTETSGVNSAPLSRYRPDSSSCHSRTRGARRRQLPGVYGPDALARRMNGLPAAAAVREGLKLRLETLRRVRETAAVAGVHLLACGWQEHVPKVLATAGLPRRLPGEGGIKSRSAAGARGAPFGPAGGEA